MTIHKDIDNIFENLMWLLDDSPRYEKCKRYINVNGKEIVNDFKCDKFAYDYIKSKHTKANEKRKKEYTKNMLIDKYGINRVIINPPAVIILWDDDTKTIAKCEKGDAFDIEKGFMVAFIKHLIGNKDFHDLLETYVWDEMEDSECISKK